MVRVPDRRWGSLIRIVEFCQRIAQGDQSHLLRGSSTTITAIWRIAAISRGVVLPITRAPSACRIGILITGNTCLLCVTTAATATSPVFKKTAQVFSSVGLTVIPWCGMPGFGVGMSKSARACATKEYESAAHGSLAPLYKRAAALDMIRAEPTWTVNGSTGTYVQDSRVLTAWSTSCGHPSQTYIRGTRKREAATSMLV